MDILTSDFRNNNKNLSRKLSDDYECSSAKSSTKGSTLYSEVFDCWNVNTDLSMSNLSSNKSKTTSNNKTERKSLSKSNAKNLRDIKEEDVDTDEHDFEIQN